MSDREKFRLCRATKLGLGKLRSSQLSAPVDLAENVGLYDSDCFQTKTDGITGELYRRIKPTGTVPGANT